MTMDTNGCCGNRFITKKEGHVQEMIVEMVFFCSLILARLKLSSCHSVNMKHCAVALSPLLLQQSDWPLMWHKEGSSHNLPSLWMFSLCAAPHNPFDMDTWNEIPCISKASHLIGRIDSLIQIHRPCFFFFFLFFKEQPTVDIFLSVGYQRATMCMRFHLCHHSVLQQVVVEAESWGCWNAQEAGGTSFYALLRGAFVTEWINSAE